MKNTKKFTLKIDTGINECGSIFSRTYILSILKETDSYSIVNFKRYDTVPTGYIEGGSEIQLSMNLKIKFKDDNINKNIAKLALKLDSSLQKVTGCVALNKSNSAITQKLKVFEKTKDTVMEL